MTPEAIVKHYGGTDRGRIRKTADALGFTTQAVYNWLNTERIPYHSQLIIELHSKGKFKAKREK